MCVVDVVVGVDLVAGRLSLAAKIFGAQGQPQGYLGALVPTVTR